jgi:hypothetical protein
MSLQVETYESLCSALYRMPFTEFLGENDVNGQRTAWFHLGEKPKDIRVSFTLVQPGRVTEAIRVTIEWRNYRADARNPLKGQKIIDILTYEATQATLRQNTERAIVTTLEIYRDVLEEEGVAGVVGDVFGDPDAEEIEDE